jgi:hypothetical protein
MGSALGDTSGAVVASVLCVTEGGVVGASLADSVPQPARTAQPSAPATTIRDGVYFSITDSSCN